MIIGLGFQARVGKGEVANWLRQLHGFTEVAFADALKASCRIIFGLSHAQLYGDAKDEIDPFWQDTPRNILKKVGTECLRKGYRDDVWVKALQRAICEPGGSAPHLSSGRYVVSDVRFPNEAEAIHSWGGKLVKIARPDAPKIATGSHASETAMSNWTAWDHILVNDGTLDQLHAKVDAMMREFSK